MVSSSSSLLFQTAQSIEKKGGLVTAFPTAGNPFIFSFDGSDFNLRSYPKEEIKSSPSGGIEYRFREEKESKLVRSGSISFFKGQGRGIVGSASPPAFEEALAQYDELIQRGQIQARDLKVRLSRSSERTGITPTDSLYQPELLASDHYNFDFGPTTFYECKEDLARSPEEMQLLQQRGLQEHKDVGFYLARGVGAVVLPITSDGKVFVGLRRSTEYDGAVHGAAGWLAFNRNPTQINPMKDAYRELQEELSVTPADVSSLHLLGVVAYPHTLETDFVFGALLKDTKSAAYFESGAWKSAVDAREHRELLALASPDDLERLVVEGTPPTDSRKMDVLTSTQYGLSVLASDYNEILGRT